MSLSISYGTPVMLLGVLFSIASCVLAVVIPAFRASSSDPSLLLKNDT